MVEYHTIVRAGTYNGRLEDALVKTGLGFSRLFAGEGSNSFLAYGLGEVPYVILASGHDGTQMTADETATTRDKYVKGHNTLFTIATSSELKAKELESALRERTGIALEDSLPEITVNLQRANALGILPILIEDQERFLESHGIK